MHSCEKRAHECTIRRRESRSDFLFPPEKHRFAPCVIYGFKSLSARRREFRARRICASNRDKYLNRFHRCCRHFRADKEHRGKRETSCEGSPNRARGCRRGIRPDSQSRRGATHTRAHVHDTGAEIQSNINYNASRRLPCNHGLPRADDQPHYTRYDFFPMPCSIAKDVCGKLIIAPAFHPARMRARIFHSFGQH